MWMVSGAIPETWEILIIKFMDEFLLPKDDFNSKLLLNKS